MLAKHFAVRTFVKALLRLDFILVFINYQFITKPIKLLFIKFLFLLAEQNLKTQLVSKLFLGNRKVLAIKCMLLIQRTWYLISSYYDTHYALITPTRLQNKRTELSHTHNKD